MFPIPSQHKSITNSTTIRYSLHLCRVSVVIITTILITIAPAWWLDVDVVAKFCWTVDLISYLGTWCIHSLSYDGQSSTFNWVLSMLAPASQSDASRSIALSFGGKYMLTWTLCLCKNEMESGCDAFLYPVGCTSYKEGPRHTRSARMDRGIDSLPTQAKFGLFPTSSVCLMMKQ